MYARRLYPLLPHIWICPAETPLQESRLFFHIFDKVTGSTLPHPGRMMLSDTRQAQLIDQLLQRDQAAFEQLYDDFSAALYGLARRILRDDALAEDVLQEAFIRIWQKIHTYDVSKGRLFTWMLNITRNLAIDKMRQAAGRQLSADKGKPLPAGTVELKVEHIGLREAVDSLPPEQKTVIELLYFHGYTQAEISAEFDIPLGTVKSRVRLAMHHLRGRIR